MAEVEQSCRTCTFLHAFHTQRQASGRQGATLPLRRAPAHATGLP